MNPPLFVIDTHALVWFVKGRVVQLGANSLVSMIHPRARIAIPSHVLTEIQQKFNPKMDGKKSSIRIPPTSLLRLAIKCSNVRILASDPVSLAWEFKLRRDTRANGIPDQDIAIAAAVMVALTHYDGPIVLVTKDGPLATWASSVRVPVIWNQRPFQFLPS
jgi:rRNA-processing protein FCF1